VTTLTGPTNTYTGFIGHWNPDGALAWAMGGGTSSRVAVAPGGPIFVGANNAVTRYTAGGAPVWTRGFSAQSYAVVDDLVVDGSLTPVVVGDHGGNLVVGALSIAPFGSFMTKHGTDGVPQWLNPVTARASTSKLAFMSGGDIIRDHTGTNGGAFVERYTPAGAPLWSRQITTSMPSGSSSIPMPVATSADGGIFVGGTSFNAAPTQPTVPRIGVGFGWFARLDGTGTIVNLVSTPGSTRALDIDDDGQVLVAGEMSANPNVSPPACTVKLEDAYVAKFAPAFLAPHIRGTVTGPGGVPAAGVTVTIMGTWPSWVIHRTLVTDAAGQFDATMNPGTYRVRFFDGQGRFTRRWWNAVSTYKVAGELPVDWNVDAVADQQLDAIEGGAIKGFVTNETTGNPVPTARVQIFNANGYVAGADVNAFGHFNVQLPPGSYWVRYVDRTRTLYSSWFGGANDFPSAVPVVVATTPVIADGTLGPWPTP
jgi:hypothetical protein